MIIALILTHVNGFFDDNSKTECDSDLEMTFVSTNLVILVIWNTMLEYLRPSGAEIEDCGMRKRAWSLAGNAHHRNKKQHIDLQTSL